MRINDLREFVLNSRHPSPRREKWGWERRLVFHFGEIRGLPGLNSGKAPDAVKTNDFDNFSRKMPSFFEKNWKRSPEDPKASPRGSTCIPNWA